MKKLLFILAILLAPVIAQATTVTVTSSTIANFNPTGLQADATLTNVTATSSSAAVSCSACFRPQWVGLGGFRIAIDGVAYTVLSVNSTSSLTLTSNFLAANTTTATVIWYKYVEVRIYADRAFQPAGASYVVQPGVPGSQAWYKRFAASIVNSSGVNTLYIPEFTIDSTTDAVGPTNQARYTMGFYRPDSSLVQLYACFEQFKVPATTPTTHVALCAYNSPAAIVPPTTEAYTKAQIDARLPSCTSDQLVLYASTGNILSCLTVGSGLQVASNTLSATGAAANAITGSGTATQVAYFTGTRVIAGSSNLYWDNSNVRLGIGTNTPSQAIHAAVSAGNSVSILADAGGTVLARLTADDSVSNAYVGTTSAHPFSLMTNSLRRLYVTSAGLVGVGEATPAAMLHVTTGSSSTIGIILDVQSNFGDSDAFRIRQSGTTRLTIDNAARIVTNPQAATSGSAGYLRFYTAPDVGLTASTDSNGIQFGGDSSAVSVTRTFATGAKTSQSEYLFVHPTYAAAAASTTADSATVTISNAPQAGSNMTLTRAYALWVESGLSRFGGNLVLGPSYTNIGEQTAGVVGLYDTLSYNGGTISAAAASPSQITSTQNDYTAGGTKSMHIRITTDASRTITGFSLSQTDGEIHYIYNVGSNDLVLSSQNTGSTSGNRMITNTGSDLTLAAGDSAMLVYDGTTSRWRVVQQGQPTSGGGGAVNAGTQYQIGYYATSGSTISALTNLTTSSTGTLTLAPTASSSGSPTLFTITGPLHTNLTVDTEAPDVYFNLQRNVQFVGGGGTFSLQRAVRMAAPTYRATSTETITTAVLLDLNTPRAGTNMTITNSYALRIAPAASGHHGILIDMITSGTGNAIEFAASGSSLGKFVAKTDRINYVLGGHSAGTTDTDGFVYLPAVGGTPTGTPTSYTNTSPITYDSTNAKLYVYSSGAWHDMTGSGGGGTISGSATATYVAYGSGANTITGENVFTYDAGTNTLSFVKWSGAGLDLDTDVTGTAALLDGAFGVIKNDANTRTFHGLYVDPTFNTGGSNANTTVNVISVDTVNTSVTGLTVNLLKLAYGGSSVLTVGSAGTITTAGSTYVSTQTTYNLLNTASTTINFGGVATTINMAGGTGAVVSLGGGANAANLRFLEPSGSGTNYIQFKAQAMAGDLTYIWPAADGTGGQVLTTDGAGTLSWSTPGGGATNPAGSGTELQYRLNATTFGAVAGSTVDTNGVINIIPTARTSGTASYFVIYSPADTTLTASTESPGIAFEMSATRQWSTGALTTQREAVFYAPTYGFVGASTLTNAATVAITGAPTAGTNATITNAYALWIQAGTLRHDGTTLSSSQTTYNLLNATTTTINFGGAATTMNIAGGSGAALNIGGGAAAAELRLLEPSGSGTNYTAFKVAAQAGNVTYTLPTADGTTGQALTTNGSGTLSWSTVAGGGSPGGAGTELQYRGGASTFSAVAGSSVDTDGVIALGPTARASGTSNYFSISSPADTGLTGSSEAIGVVFDLSATRQHSSGTITTQREMVIYGPTYSFTSASTISSAATLAITAAPAAGTNATITRSVALWLQAGNLRVDAAGSSTQMAIQLVDADTGFYTSGSSSSNRFLYAVAGGVPSLAISASSGFTILNGSYGLQFGSSGVSSPDAGIRRAKAGVVGMGSQSSVGNTWRAVADSPSQITANQNNYTAGSGLSFFQRWSTDASRNITGYSTGQVDGEVHCICNVGSFDIVLKNEDANSTAANRFHNSTGADITLSADQCADVIYDNTTARWRVYKRN